MKNSKRFIAVLLSMMLMFAVFCGFSVNAEQTSENIQGQSEENLSEVES